MFNTNMVIYLNDKRDKLSERHNNLPVDACLLGVKVNTKRCFCIIMRVQVKFPESRQVLQLEKMGLILVFRIESYFLCKSFESQSRQTQSKQNTVKFKMTNERSFVWFGCFVQTFWLFVFFFLSLFHSSLPVLVDAKQQQQKKKLVFDVESLVLINNLINWIGKWSIYVWLHV